MTIDIMVYRRVHDYRSMAAVRKRNNFPEKIASSSCHMQLRVPIYYHDKL